MAPMPGPVGTVGSAAAPQFIAPAPPGRVQMTLQQHYDAILALFRARPPRSDEVAATQQFFQQWTAMLAEEQQQQGGAMDPSQMDPSQMGQQGPPPGGAAANLNGATDSYGSSAGASDLQGY